MSTDSWQSNLARPLVQLQIIVAAMVGGCLFFLAIALVVRPNPTAAGGDGQPLLTWIGLAAAGGALVLRMIVPGRVVAIGRLAMVKEIDRAILGSSPNLLEDPVHGGQLAGRLAALFMTRTIVACAIVEGATFFLLVVYFAEGQLLALGAAIFLILVLGGNFPTRSTFLPWIDGQARRIDEETQLGRQS
jgi:hypothetical protein